jgi:hypothetical protein
MTDWNARTIEIPLAFLGPGRWSAALWRDGPDSGEEATHAIDEVRSVTARDRLSIPLAPGGGLAVRFTRAAVQRGRVPR